MSRWVGIGDFPIGDEERAAIYRVLDSNRISEHREVKGFEREFADYLDVRYVVAVSSGTAALICGLLASIDAGKISPLSTVKIPALTFIATANAVRAARLNLDFADVDDDFVMSSDQVNDLDEVIMPVHLFGYPADVDEIKVNAPSAAILEDACESHGSLYKDRMTGTLGLWSAYSFYIAHTVQAGELGCVATNDHDIAQAVRRIKAHGRQCSCDTCRRREGKCPYMKDHDPRYHHVTYGLNFKPMEFQAALARLQLSRIEYNISRRTENFIRLHLRLADMQDYLILPRFDPDVAYMAFPLVLRDKRIDRHVLARYMEKNGVESRPIFGCIPTQQPAFARYKEYYTDKLYNAERIGSRGFFVGCHQYLTDSDLDHTADIIAKGILEQVK